MTHPRHSRGLSRSLANAKFAAAAGNQPPPASPHLDALANAPGELRQIMNEHNEAMRTLRGQATSDSPEERARIVKLAGPVQQRTQQRIGDLAGRVDAAHTALHTAARRALPAPAGGVEGLLGRQAQWQRAKTMLDAGLAPADVITETTDPEMLHALAEELPSYLRSQGASPEHAQAAATAVHDRLAEVTGGPAADARVAARTADVHRAGLDHLVPYAQRRAALGPFDRAASGLHVPIAAQMARDSVAAGLPRPDDQAEPGQLSGRIATAMHQAARNPALNSQQPTPA